MKIRTFLGFVSLAATMGPVHAFDGEPLRVEHCHASPSPVARIECEKRQKEREDAQRRELQVKRIEDARAKKNSSLCFTRKETGETICPN